MLGSVTPPVWPRLRCGARCSVGCGMDPGQGRCGSAAAPGGAGGVPGAVGGLVGLWGDGEHMGGESGVQRSSAGGARGDMRVVGGDVGAGGAQGCREGLWG